MKKNQSVFSVLEQPLRCGPRGWEKKASFFSFTYILTYHDQNSKRKEIFLTIPYKRLYKNNSLSWAELFSFDLCSRRVGPNDSTLEHYGTRFFLVFPAWSNFLGRILKQGFGLMSGCDLIQPMCARLSVMRTYSWSRNRLNVGN